MTDQDEAMRVWREAWMAAQPPARGMMRSIDEMHQAAAAVIRAALDKARNDALEEAAKVAYARCASTRHVSLGDAVSDAIRALKGGKHD